MERLQPQFSEPTVDVTPGISNIDFEQLNRSADEARRAPFDDLARRLDQLVDSSVKSSDFMIESNAIQAQVAEELKTSGDSASFFSKANIGLSLAIIVLTVMSLTITAYATYESFKQDAAWQAFSADAVNDISNKLEGVSGLPEMVDHYEQLSEGQMAELKTENAFLREEVERLKNRLQNLEARIE